MKEFWKSIRFDKVITISWVVHFFGTQCRWNSTGCRRRLCIRLLWPLTFWPNPYVSCAGKYMTQFWWKFYEDIVLTRFFGLLPAVTLGHVCTCTWDIRIRSKRQSWVVHFFETQCSFVDEIKLNYILANTTLQCVRVAISDCVDQ